MSRRLRRHLLVAGVSLVIAEVCLRLVLGNLEVAPLQTHLPDGRCVGLEPGGQRQYTGWLLRVPPVLHDANEYGYRGTAVPPGPPSSAFRIVALGDSFTYGQGVPAEASLPAALERELAARMGAPVEVLNFGVPGLNLDEYAEQYRLFARRWQADLVLVFLFDNDLDAPLCNSIGSSGRWWMVRHVYLTRVAFGLFEAIRHRSRPSHSTPELQSGLEKMLEPVRANETPLTVVVVRDPLDNRADAEAAASGAGISLVYMADGLRDIPAIQNEWHWSSEGNELAAKRIAGELIARGLIDASAADRRTPLTP
jgi:hypothetical protein